MNRLLPSRAVLVCRPLGRVGVGDLLSDATNTINDVTGGSTDTSSTDTSTPVETNTSGVSTPIDDSGSTSPNFVTPPPGPTGLAAVPAWVWIAGAGAAAAMVYEFVLKK